MPYNCFENSTWFFLQMDTGKAKADEESSSEEDSSEEEKPSKTKKQKAKGVNYTSTCTLKWRCFGIFLVHYFFE